MEAKQKKSNPWLEHVKKFRQDNPKLSYKEVLQQARKTYTKVKPVKKEAKPKAKKEAKAKKEPKAKKETKKAKGGSVDRSAGMKKLIKEIKPFVESEDGVKEV